MRLGVLALGVALAGCTCDSPLVSRVCASNDDCGAKARCRDGVCVPFIEVPSVKDAGCGAACELQCGGVRCARGERCRGDVCVSGCAALTCDAGTVCDPALPACVGPVTPVVCLASPPPGPWELVERWHYTPTDTFRHVIASPVVADVDHDGAADVIALFCPDNGYVYAGKLRAMSGVDGRPLWQTQAEFAAATGLAVGARDGEGRLSVFAVTTEGNLVSFDARSGAELWRTLGRACPKPVIQNLGPSWDALGLADFNRDGVAEVYCGDSAFSAIDGTPVTVPNSGAVGGYYGTVPIVFRETPERSNAIFSGALSLGLGRNLSGFPAVADLLDFDARPGQDRAPELVVSGQGRVAVTNHRAPLVTLEALLPSWDGDKCSTPAVAKELGGAPTIANFAGDGQPEIAVAGTACLTVFGLDVGPEGTQLTPRWSRPVRDVSSGVAGASAFDLDGDGLSELLYADENAFHIFDGPTGVEKVTLPHCSATTYDMPVVADLDGDGSAEIVLAENTFAANLIGCDGGTAPGIRVLAEKRGRFANTRPIWNQHSYHVTNVCDGEDLVCGGPFDPRNVPGAIPKNEPDSWTFVAAGGVPFNAYRANLSSGFSRADLAVGAVAADERQCPTRLTLKARVENRGARSVPPGVDVAFQVAGVTVAAAKTALRLRPGDFENVSAVWMPAAGIAWPVQLQTVVNPAGLTAECEPGNNVGPVISVRCD